MNLLEIILGRYEIDDLLPSGGQADVAGAVDQQTGNRVAVKRLNIDQKAKHFDQELARFRRAAQTVIGHPVVVDPIDSGEQDGWHYTIFPFIDGPQLDIHVQKSGGRLSETDALAIVKRLAEGLDAIHAKGIVHRDLKPANILMASDHEPRIIDLGICRHTHEATLTQGSAMIGTLAWMSPEQVQDSSTIDHRSDLYALGAILYFMLTGRSIARGTSPGSMAVDICQNLPPSPRQVNADISNHVDQVCMKLLAKPPKDRYQSASELLNALGNGAASSSNGDGEYCSSCGRTIERQYQFCPGCGAPQHLAGDPERCLACGARVNGHSTCPNCQRGFSPSNHRLIFETGSLTGITYRVPEGIYIVGRDALDPRDGQISRRHFHVASSNGSVQIQDAGSTNRTLVDHQPADHPITLTPGGHVVIAGNTATYSNR